MIKQLNLFIISSPLQLLTTTNIRLQYPTNLDEKSVLFIEGERYHQTLAEKNWDTVIVAHYARPRIDPLTKNIRLNLHAIDQLIAQYQPQTLKLYISDLYWVSNNVIYAHLLKRFKQNFSCALFDEGCVLYTKQYLLMRDRLRSIAKWLSLKLCGLPYQVLHTSSFDQNNIRIKTIYCYHPELFDHGRQCKSTALHPEKIHSFLDQLTRLQAPKNLQMGTLLFLSQPYFHHMSFAKLRIIMQNFCDYFLAQGIKTFYVKPHHLDHPEWSKILHDEFHFKPYPGDAAIGIEATARYLDFEYIAAFSSSALLNLQKFGYQGKVVSYGLKQFNQHKETRRMNQNIQTIFQKKGILLIG